MATPTNAPNNRASLIRSTTVQNNGESIFRLVPCALVSVVFNGGLVAALFLLPQPADSRAMEAAKDVKIMREAAKQQDKLRMANMEEDKKKQLAEELKKAKEKKPFITDAKHISKDAKEPDFDPTKSDRKVDKPVETKFIANPLEPVGIDKGSKEVDLFKEQSLGKINGVGTPSADFKLLPTGPSMNPGQLIPEGNSLIAEGAASKGTTYKTDKDARETLVKAGGGNSETEVAVIRGLKFLKRMQKENGSWKLDDDAYEGKGKGVSNDVAATAFGMLPFLGRGVTMEPIPGDDLEFHKVVEAAFKYLKSKQDKKTGLISFDENGQHGGYAHALATIALAELYGMIKDKDLKKNVEPVVQKAVKYLIEHQCNDGGWGYLNDKNRSDLSVGGWAIMALKSADLAGLDVPKGVMDKAARYLDSVVDEANEGYRYTKDSGASPRMAAVGLLCRQYLDGWNATNNRMNKGVDNFILKLDFNTNKAQFTVHPDQTRDIYYFYYATQVMHHYGEDHWPVWNQVMRDHLLKTQLKDPGESEKKLDGSWNPAGDGFAGQGGRLMYTSLCLLTLEVYYRHLPLYYKDQVSGNK
jgi:hypothetical protein